MGARRSGRPLFSMSRVHLLSDTLASQVAAGEVIERPASVVKELVENSLDAAARSIEIMIRRGGGEAPGTQIEVRSLFYNLPARRKFLRSENTETRHIEHQLNLQAIGHPGIAFSLVRDERVVLQLPAAKTLRDRIRDLMGSELLARLLE